MDPLHRRGPPHNKVQRPNAKRLPQMEQVLSLMLQGGYLAARERLRCFRSSKGMAELVLRHAVCTCLNLNLTHPLEMTDTPTALLMLMHPAEVGHSSRERAAAHATAQQLAAPSANVMLALHGGVLAPAACLRPSITTLRLVDMPLDQTSSSQLQLHQLPRLHTLSFRHCRITAGSSSTSSPQHRTTSVRTLEWFRHNDDPFPSAFGELVDPSQVHTLITNQASCCKVLSQLPALQELRFTSGRHYDIGIGEVHIGDSDFQQLLAHPRLARVQLHQTQLGKSHSETPCAWESLHLLDGVALTQLARMPLAGIRSCAVHGCLRTDRPDTTAAVAAIHGMVSDRPPHLVFQADSHNAACFWTPSEPSFQVINDGRGGPGSAQLITLAMRHLAPNTALVLGRFDTGSPEVAASLAAAPPTLTTVAFLKPQREGELDPLGAGVIADGMLAYMPHVRHVAPGMQGPSTEWLTHVRLLVAGVSRPLQLTLVLTEQWAEWQAGDQEEICQCVTTCASEHVTVVFKVTRP